jgi:hypothetical protein
MSVSGNSYCFFTVRLGLALAALSAWLVVPATFAQSVSSSADYSSSAEYHQSTETLVQDQYPSRPQGGYSRQGYPHQENNTSVLSHIAIEAGGGFNRPVGVTRSFATWGGNVEIGSGWNFNKSFGVLAEWEYFSNKIPGAYLSNAGVPGGHIHTWGLTLEPTYNFKTSGSLGGYIIGGGGFYRRVTTFTVPEQEEECSYFCFLVNVNVPIAHYSSNQGGLNLGGGVTWKAFGEDSSGRLFAEGRYVRVNSPKTNVFGTPDGNASFVPVTLGLRW